MKKRAKFGYMQKIFLRSLDKKKTQSLDELYKLAQENGYRYARSYLTPVLLRMQRYELVTVDWTKEKIKLGRNYDKRTIV